MEEMRTLSSYSVEELEEQLDILLADQTLLEGWACEEEMQSLDLAIRRIKAEIASRG